MARLTVVPCDATLGAVVRGPRLADLSDDEWDAVQTAFHEHAVLVFPGQHLSDEEQKAFGRRFGSLERIGEEPGLDSVSNLTKDGQLRRSDDPVLGILRGNEGWHTDSSYMPVSAKASILSARVVPTSGSSTEWADMRAAYDALPEATKEKVADLYAYHSVVKAQARIGEPAVEGQYGHNDGPPPLRPLVKIHPVTRRPSLFVGRHAYAVPGMTEHESALFLEELINFACRPPRVLTHPWQVGDVVLWDNRCLLHRARPWNFTEPRVMKHTRVAGDPETESALQ